MDYPKLISEKWNLTAKFNCPQAIYFYAPSALAVPMCAFGSGFFGACLFARRWGHNIKFLLPPPPPAIWIPKEDLPPPPVLLDRLSEVGGVRGYPCLEY